MDVKSEVVVSGIRATGRLHLGNYIGAMQGFIPLQEKYKCYIFAADYHTLTSLQNPDQLRSNLPEIIRDYLAAGLDPEKSVIFAQSSVPEIAELSLLLSMVITMGELDRCPTLNERIKTDSIKNANLGLYSYPVLMAADILIQQANVVPVGKDQEPHVNMTRSIARHFNEIFGQTFTLPTTMIRNEIMVPGLDGSRKMGKSDHNTIDLSDTPERIREKVKVAVTDTGRVRRSDPGNPNNCRLFDLHKLVTGWDIVKGIEVDCKSAKIGCVDCKAVLSDSLITIVDPIRENRQAITPDYVGDVLHSGGIKARSNAQQTIEVAREKMGLSRF